MDDLKKKLGANMRMARHRKGLTQEQVADGGDISAEVYGRLERGAVLPRLDLFVTLCHGLGATPDQLLGFSGTRLKDSRTSRSSP